MSGFSLAQQPEIIHGENKDKELLSTFKQKLLDFLEHMLPAQVLFRNASWIGSLASLLYYGANSMRLRQTLGEEYAYLRQYNVHDHVFISRKRLVLYVLLETFGETVIIKFLSNQLNRWIRKQVEEAPEELHKLTLLQRLCLAFCRQVGDSQGIFDTILKLHTAIFYLNGSYFTIAKRLAGIRFMQSVKIPQHAFTYRRIGLLILFQLIVGLAIKAYRVTKDAVDSGKPTKIVERRKESEERGQTNLGNPGEPANALNCGICFDTLNGPSAIPCGHVFCWNCIVKSSQFKGECPSCRKNFETKEITFLGNINV